MILLIQHYLTEKKIIGIQFTRSINERKLNNDGLTAL